MLRELGWHVNPEVNQRVGDEEEVSVRLRRSMVGPVAGNSKAQ